jgi:hypothetical protein
MFCVLHVERSECRESDEFYSHDRLMDQLALVNDLDFMSMSNPAPSASEFLAE